MQPKGTVLQLQAGEGAIDPMEQVDERPITTVVAEIEKLNPTPEDLDPAEIFGQQEQGAVLRVLPFFIAAFATDPQEVLGNDVEESAAQIEGRSTATGRDNAPRGRESASDACVLPPTGSRRLRRTTRSPRSRWL